ncbi:MAG: hypothetical protein J6O41_04390, partial [Clostridia bacterium]|nr:hypothetical protein [Clostridia bacterium]
ILPNFTSRIISNKVNKSKITTQQYNNVIQTKIHNEKYSYVCKDAPLYFWDVLGFSNKYAVAIHYRRYG